MSTALDSFTRAASQVFERSAVYVRNRPLCPYISAAQESFAVGFHMPGYIQSPGQTASVTGDCILYGYTGIGSSGAVVTVPLKPGIWTGHFTFNRGGEDNTGPTDLEDVGISIWLQPITSNDDYRQQTAGDGLGQRSWRSFQNVNGIFSGPSNARNWANLGLGPDLEYATWPDEGDYEWLSGLEPDTNVSRYRCPFRLWIFWNVGLQTRNNDKFDFDFTLTGQRERYA